MTEQINERVQVAMVFAPEKGDRWPCLIAWRNKKWRVTENGLHHYYKQGDRLYHVYQVVVNGYLQMRLQLDSLSLLWTLEAVSDGQAE
jgi:hypothetical protein